MFIDRSPHDREPQAMPELFALISTLIRKIGRAALASAGENGDLHGAIVQVAQASDGAPVFALPRDDENAQRLLRDARVGLLIVDGSSMSNGARITLVGTVAASHQAGTVAFRLRIERIRFASPARSAWYRVAIRAEDVH